MSSSPIPPSLEHLAERPFSFYPPIVNIEHNEWLFRKATWSEIEVVNCRTGMELWISRRFIGEVSKVEDPVLIVGLNRELELKAGMLIPCQRRVLQMPPAAGSPVAGAAGEEQHAPPRTAGPRLEENDRRAVRLVLVSIAVVAVIAVGALGLLRVGEWRQKNPVLVGSDQSYAGLGSHDDYFEVTQKIGRPTTDREQEAGTIFFRALGYPERRYTVILMGRDKSSMTYIGTMDPEWRPIHFVNSQTESLLRQLPDAIRKP
jgi:hypothetical protein